MSGLAVARDDDEPRCAVCGAIAAGPCASCRAFVCGDCSVLTEGGVELWAICVRCDRRKGRSLAAGWGTVTLWLLLLLVGLALFAGLSIWLVH